MSEPMTRRDDAIEAALHDLADGLLRNSSPGYIDPESNAAEHAEMVQIIKALARAMPSSPSSSGPMTKALDHLPVGSVISSAGDAYVYANAWEWVETVTGTAWTADELATRHPHWHAIHTPQEN